MHTNGPCWQDGLCPRVAPSAKKVALISPCASVFTVKEGGRLIVLFLGALGGTQVSSEGLKEWPV